jgi:hypothetical protein
MNAAKNAGNVAWRTELQISNQYGGAVESGNASA